MLNLILLITALATIIAVELPPLIRKKMWGEAAAFSVLMLLAAILSIAMTADIEIPNPTQPLMDALKPLSDLIFLR